MPRNAGFDAVVAAAAEQLAGCEQAGSGCFADDPAAYAELMGRGADAGYQETLLRLASAATDAGAAGVPLEQATVTTWTLVPDTEANQRYADEMAARGRTWAEPANYQKLADGPEVPLMGELPAEPPEGDRRAQIVNCAYMCGRAGVGNCPILALPQKTA